ncbi:restriction endonuclease [Halosimplex carlsbadense]|uniref:restriction endonuclease n=1 Tax=Halosimplex carlsbadense TaxID=171164 RepID=UPI0009E1D133|nr:restriction endonuclease [Halosimplex carlsbadense]
MNTDRTGTMTVDLASSKELQTLLDLTPREFEHFVADVWQERQEWTTEVMDSGPDRGLDVIGQPPNGGPKTAVQCKRYDPESSQISEPNVREYAALRQQWEDVEGVTIVTTSTFSRNAREIADRLDVKCINGEDLVRLVHRYNATEILNWYAAGRPEEW